MLEPVAHLESVAVGEMPASPEEIARVLEQIAAATGDRRYERAARALFRKCGSGRRPCADDALVGEAEWLLETSQAATPEEASKMIAAAHPGQSFEAVQKRIARKVRATIKTGTQKF